MLDRDILNRFSKLVNIAYQQFCVWQYTKNTFNKLQEKFNKEGDEMGCKFKNFWQIVIVSLQDQWLLSVAKLLDSPDAEYLQDDKRLSVWYILDLIDNDDIKNEFTLKINNEFKYSNRDLRDCRLVHNSLNKNPKTQKAGMEDFFEALDKLVKRIKKDFPNLNECDNVGLERAEELSKKGVEEIFEMISS